MCMLVVTFLLLTLFPRYPVLLFFTWVWQALFVGPRKLCHRMTEKHRRVGTAIWFSLMIGIFVAALLKVIDSFCLTLFVLVSTLLLEFTFRKKRSTSEKEDKRILFYL